MYKALTIAGSDSSGGAGIQADLKTFCAHGIYGMSVITAITAQNTCGVYAVQDISTNIVAAQMDAVFGDIYPDAVKIGMVSSTDIIKVIAGKIKEHGAGNIVLDTVMVSTSGCSLISENAQNTLVEELLPLADIITPNIPEAEVLCGFEIKNMEHAIKAAEKISEICKGYILIKGGHLDNTADDLLYKDSKFKWFHGKRVYTQNTHGTGCTLSSAIASNLAAGFQMDAAVESAKAYVTKALKAGLDLGKGNGPLNHMV